MSGYRLTAICRSQWDMAIFLQLFILSKIYSKDIMSRFTIYDILGNNFLSIVKYILPLFGTSKNISTVKDTVQGRLNTLCLKTEFMDRVLYEYYYLTKAGKVESDRIYSEFIDFFSNANTLISTIENKFIASDIHDFNSFFINVEKTYEILTKFKLLSQNDADLNLKIIYERVSKIDLDKNNEKKSIINSRKELASTPEMKSLLGKLGMTPEDALKFSIKNTKV